MPSAVQFAVEVGPGQSGPVGLLVLIALIVLCTFLFRSMTKQLRRVPRSFDPPNSPPAGAPPVTRPDDRGDA